MKYLSSQVAAKKKKKKKKNPEMRIKTEQDVLITNLPTKRPLPISITKSVKIKWDYLLQCFESMLNSFSHYFTCKVNANWIKPRSLGWEILLGVRSNNNYKASYFKDSRCHTGCPNWRAFVWSTVSFLFFWPFIYFWYFLPAWMHWTFHFTETSIMANIYIYFVEIKLVVFLLSFKTRSIS